MKFKSTLILLVIAALFGGYLYFIEKDRETTKDAQDRKGQFVKLDRSDDKIHTITIKNPEAKFDLKKGEGDQWRIESDKVRDRADTFAVTNLFTAVESLRADQSINPKDKDADKDILKTSGLEDSTTKITFVGDKTIELIFGKDTAVEGKVYVKVDGKDEIHVVSNELRNQVTKKIDEFRDKKLSEIETSKVTKLTVKRPDGEMELVRDEKENTWKLVKPLATRADETKANDLVAQVASARIDTFVADGTKLQEYGLTEPRGTVSLWVEGSDQPQVLQIGALGNGDTDKDKVYAKFSAREGVVLLPKTVETLLTTQPNDVRDRKLVHASADIVDRITIEPAGKEKMVLARDKDNWVRKEDKDIPINRVAAERLLADLQNVTVSEFVADTATELPKYGLDQPVVKVTLSSYASENTAESDKGEKVITKLLFGGDANADVYVKIDDEPFILSVPRTIMDAIVTDPLQLQSLDIYQHKPEDVTGFDVTKEGQGTLTFERAPDKTWKLAKGDGTVNQTAAQSLVNTLAKLRAVRWEGATQPTHGLDKPRLVATFKTAANTVGKLNVGGKSDGDMYYASADGLTGTFVITGLDYNALNSELLEKPATAATPMPNGDKAPASATTPPITVTTPPVSVDAAPEPKPAPETAKPQPTEASKPQTDSPAPVPPAPEPAENKPAPEPEKPAPMEEKPAPAEEKPAPAEEKPAPEKPEGAAPEPKDNPAPEAPAEKAE